MYMLQLFDAIDEVRPIDARLLRDGTLRIGRDGTADWPIVDPDCALSRWHCDLTAGEAGLTIRSLGTNGVFDERTGERLPDQVAVPVELPFAFRLGTFRINVSHAPHGDDEDVARTLVMTPPLGTSIEVPTQWSDGEAPVRSFTEGSLLEAFCDGAGLDASMLSTEEPTEIMRRAGAVYRQMVLGIGDLMAERERARGRYQLTRTTIGGAGNNPFKWAPTQRLAVDLLLTGNDGFLSGPAALKSSFQDIKRHLVATFAGLHGSLVRAVDTFAPAALDEAAGKRAGLLKSRSAAQGQEVADRHADLSRQLNEGADGSLNRAFVIAYDAAESRIVREP